MSDPLRAHKQGSLGFPVVKRSRPPLSAKFAKLTAKNEPEGVKKELKGVSASEFVAATEQTSRLAKGATYEPPPVSTPLSGGRTVPSACPLGAGARPEERALCAALPSWFPLPLFRVISQYLGGGRRDVRVETIAYFLSFLPLLPVLTSALYARPPHPTPDHRRGD